MPVSGTGIPAATGIKSVDSATQVTLSANATGSSTTALVFAPYGVGGGSSTFGIPNRAYVGVGRDNASGSASNVTQVSTSLNTTLSSTLAVVGSAAGLFPGMFVTQGSFPNGTTIISISGTNVILSNVASANGVLAARFSPILDAQTLGAKGGALSQSMTLVTANLPASPSGTIAVSATIPVRVFSTTGSNDVTHISLGSNAGADAGLFNPTTTGSTFNGAAQGGTSTPILTETVQPTIVMNYIIKR
jgi:hypothetical protein